MVTLTGLLSRVASFVPLPDSDACQPQTCESGSHYNARKTDIYLCGSTFTAMPPADRKPGYLPDINEYTREQCSGVSWQLAPLWGRKYTIRLQPKCSEDLSVIHAKLFSHSTCFCPEIMRPLSGRE